MRRRPRTDTSHRGGPAGPAALAVPVLLALAGCTNAPVAPIAPAPAAVEARATTPPDPSERYLFELDRRGVSSAMTDTQLVQIGQAVCSMIPLLDRRTAIDTVANQSVNGDVAAGQAIVDSAQTVLCPSADYAPAVARSTPAPRPTVSVAVSNAAETAGRYLGIAGFSRQKLIEQLEYEGYTADEAAEAVDSLDVNYNAEAVESAQSYLDLTSFSRSGLIDQLEYEGYTSAQAEHGASQTYR